MNGSILLTSVAAIVAALSLGFPPTQDGKQGKPQDAAAAHDMTPPKPGKEHDALKKYTGTWDCLVKHSMSPDGPWTESKGTETNKLVCNGLWLETDVLGDMGPMGKFEGHGLQGWDTTQKKYKSSWVDTMCTYLCVQEGTWDDKTSTMTWTMEGPDMTGKTAKFRSTDVVKGDTRELNCWQTGSDGKEWKCMTIAYTKKK